MRGFSGHFRDRVSAPVEPVRFGLLGFPANRDFFSEMHSAVPRCARENGWQSAVICVSADTFMESEAGNLREHHCSDGVRLVVAQWFCAKPRVAAGSLLNAVADGVYEPPMNRVERGLEKHATHPRNADDQPGLQCR
jgi:hypothetical protein